MLTEMETPLAVGLCFDVSLQNLGPQGHVSCLSPLPQRPLGSSLCQGKAPLCEEGRPSSPCVPSSSEQPALLPSEPSFPCCGHRLSTS